ncbi:MAG: Clp protease N-terminal domain-containing protein, partial [Burkholderiales bacterium]|nr:Clp protease N-terminal domain-containing protein [Anaerolineae bacterium]
VTADQIEALVKEMSQAGTRRSPSAPLELSIRTRRALELAVDEARLMGHDYVGTEHLLLGILRQNDSTAANILRRLGLDLERVRQTTRSMILLKSVPEPETFNRPIGGGSAENLKVLQMIEDGKISASEGTELLQAMQPRMLLGAGAPGQRFYFSSGPTPMINVRDAESLRLRLRITEKSTGSVRGDISLPFLQMQESTAAMARQVLFEGQREGKIYEMDDGDQHIEVLIEDAENSSESSEGNAS